jgi:uncharacterized protein YciI
MTTFYAAFLRPGTRWDPQKPVREQLYWDAHARFMDALFETGAIILAGPFADRSGSLVIVSADSAAQVREMFRDDPWAERDVLAVADVKEWTLFLDGRQKP